jgi:hypothetical protein
MVSGTSPVIVYWNYVALGGLFLVDKGYDIIMSYWSTSGLGVLGTASAGIYGINLVYAPTQQENFVTDFTVIDSSGTLETQGTSVTLDGLDTDSQEVKLFRVFLDHPFLDFFHRFRVTVDPATGNDAEIGWWALSNEIGSLRDWFSNGSQALAVGWFANNIWVRDYATGNSNWFFTSPGSYGIQVERDLEILSVYIMDTSFTTVFCKLELLIDPAVSYIYLWAYNSPNSVPTPLLKWGSVSSLDEDSVSALAEEHYYYGVISELEIYQALYFRARALVSTWYAVQGDILLNLTPDAGVLWKMGYETNVLIDIQPSYEATFTSWSYVPNSGITVSGTSDLYVTWNYETTGYQIIVTPNALAWTGVRYYYDPVFGDSGLWGNRRDCYWGYFGRSDNKFLDGWL